MNILIIDIGTSSIRGILYDEAGQNLAFVQLKYEPVSAGMRLGGTAQRTMGKVCGRNLQKNKRYGGAKKQGNRCSCSNCQRSSVIPS